MITYLKEKYTDKDIKNTLNPIVDAWFKYKFKSYSEPQRYAIKSIHEGKNTLIVAPTGTGKTLAAFATVISELVNLSEKQELEDKVYAIYISPLKALNNDIEKNLNVPLNDIKKAMKKLNKDLKIRVGVRTSDTTQAEKSKMLKKPPHILITTPESLALILTTKKFIEKLKDVKWLIIDEIHSLADNKRGVHLSLSMERLQKYAQNIVRIGLSATVAPLEEVAKFLVGVNRSCNIVSVNYNKKLSLDVVIPFNFISSKSEDIFDKTYEAMHKIIQNHKTVLIFTNTRAATENVVHNLKEKYPDYYNDSNISAHHSSLSKDLRLNTEKMLKEGKLKVVISSTSLELGIDIGNIDAVILLNSPKSIARALQRFGRSGHNLHDKIKGYFLATDYDELVECSIIKKTALEGYVDRIKVIENALDVLTQHIYGLSIESEQNIDETYKLIKNSYCYRNLSYSDYYEVLKYLAGTYNELEKRNVYAKIYLNDKTFRARGKLSRMLYMTNIGVIPDEAKVKVKLGNFIIGNLDELFVERLRKGDVFVLGGQTYEFLYMRNMTIYVKTAFAKPPTVPAWFSETLPLSFDLANKIREFRTIMQDFFDINERKENIIDFLKDYLHETNSIILDTIYDYFATQYLFYKSFSGKKEFIIERYDDGQYHYVFNTLFGRKINDVFSTLIAFFISKKIKRDILINLTDNGFMLTSDIKINIENILNEILKYSNDELIQILSYAIKSTILFTNRFRHNAVRFLMILRYYHGVKKTVGKQTVSAKYLLKAVESIDPNFPVIKETVREILYDVMDLANALELIKEIKNKKLRYKLINLEHHSLFSTNIVVNGMSNILRISDRLNYLKTVYLYITQKKGV